MFGGWKTQWYQGYNLPASKFIEVDGNSYTLSIDMGVPFDSVVTDKLTVRGLRRAVASRRSLVCVCVLCCAVCVPSVLVLHASALCGRARVSVCPCVCVSVCLCV
jgi:hypothetical protein